jgi:hypothetical protein
MTVAIPFGFTGVIVDDEPQRCEVPIAIADHARGGLPWSHA